MSRFETRLTRLESRACTFTNPSCFPPEIEAAKHRALARLYRKLGIVLDASAHPRVQWATALLEDDPPLQAATDLDILKSWGATHPERLYPNDEGAAARISAKLDEIARRLEAQP